LASPNRVVAIETRVGISLRYKLSLATVADLDIAQSFPIHRGELNLRRSFQKSGG
jgi:hypothetical protein